MRWMIPLAIVAGLSATPANAQDAPDDSAPQTRAAFEEKLLQAAHPDSLATDVAGAWIQFYQYLFPSRFIDRALYEQAMLRLAEADPERCGKPAEPAARLACVANIGADAASLLTAFVESSMLRRDAIEFLERSPETNAAQLIDASLSLASNEWFHGSLAQTQELVSRASGLLAQNPAQATRARKRGVAVLQAMLADAQLDDQKTSAALNTAIELDLAKAGEDEERGISRNFGLDDLILKHFQGRFCPACQLKGNSAIKRWITSKAAESYHAMLLALAAPADVFTRSELQQLSRQYLAQVALGSPAVEELRRRMPKGIDDIALVRSVALFESVFSHTLDDQSSAAREWVTFLSSKNPKQRLTTATKFLKAIAGEISNLGADRDIVEVFEAIAFHFGLAGQPEARRAALQIMVDQFRERRGVTDRGLVHPDGIRIAGSLVPALAQLAALRLAAGDRAGATAALNEARALARAKLRTEWESGSTGTVLAMRGFADALAIMVETRHALAARSSTGGPAAGQEELFQAMQAALFGETALTLEIAQQRRILTTPQAEALRRSYSQAATEASRMTEVVRDYADYNYAGLIVNARHAAEERRNALGARLAALVPGAGDISGDLDEVGYADARRSLAGGEALVLLHAGAQSLTGFLMDADGRTQVWQSPIRVADLAGLVSQLHAGGDMSDGRIPTFPFADAARLHNVVFGPVKPMLGKYRKLIVLGNGPLQALPYSILLTEAPKSVPGTAEAFRGAALRWMIRTHAIALIPSVRSLVNQRGRSAPSVAAKAFLGVGNPVLAPASPRRIDMSSLGSRSGGTLADVDLLRTLPSLPETEVELRSIAKTLDAAPDDVMVAERATEANIKALRLSDYRIITFATHGALAGEVLGTSEPGLVLTPPAKPSGNDDGFLGLSEIVNLKLDAELVILSACNTATSDGRPRAEALSGLARGFFSAGARSLIVTHWTIPSDSAVSATTGLIRAQATNPRLDWSEALRQATLAIIDSEGPPRWAHPSFWGAFAVVGVRPIAVP